MKNCHTFEVLNVFNKDIYILFNLCTCIELNEHMCLCLTLVHDVNEWAYEVKHFFTDPLS